jgi:hypothetical protein
MFPEPCHLGAWPSETPVAVAGGDNLGLIALVEAEHIRVQKENRHGSFGLAPIGAFLSFPLGAIRLHCRQPGVEQWVFG